MAEEGSNQILAYIGTFANDPQKGIYLLGVDPRTGELEPRGHVPGLASPFFLALDPLGRCLYAAEAAGDDDGQRDGEIAAYAVDPAGGGLTLLNRQPSCGRLPCYVSIHPSGRWLLAGNYMSGSVALLPIAADGRLGAATDVAQHAGSGPNAERQEGPHVHCAVQDPSGRFAYAADLGIDRLMIYRIDAERGKLSPADPPWVQTRPGAGPRHFACHPDGRHAYLINELDSTLVAYACDGASGRLTEVQTVSALPAGYSGESFCADVQVHPSGRFLYGTNRGHDSVVVFAVDASSGQLSLIGHESTQGQYPWNLGLLPDGSLLLVANHGGDSVVSFRVDRLSGRLRPTGHRALVPKAVCVRLATR
ncbi:MAG: lactonase family protein [Candidatus Latescibacterota bacterium]